MIETLISSKTRIKLLLKFFLNSKATSYLRGLETEFGESSNGIRVELNRFEKAGMLNSFTKGNKKYFRANTDHPLYVDMHNIILKYIGFDKIIDNVLENLGDIHKVFVTGALAKGLDDKEIDLVLIGTLNNAYLDVLIEKVEKLIHRRINCCVFNSEEFGLCEWEKHNSDALLLWEN
ncbi:MAG: ArsR family transcriptional regulator [Saprospiraceae bacterium]|nr:ArsR family transcriptional regulator [Saprospiraceae bacterium]